MTLQSIDEGAPLRAGRVLRIAGGVLAGRLDLMTNETQWL